MPMIEGVGDEVLVVVGLFLLLCLVLLAWFSTHTRDIPFVSVIVVELSQRRRRGASNGDGSEQGGEEERVNEPPTDSASSGASKDAAGSNNNADTASDSGEDSASAAAAKNDVDSALQPVPGGETKSSDAQCAVPSQVCESESRELTERVAEGSSPEEEAVTIPPFRQERDSGEEVRRRRVAYYSGGVGRESSEVEKKDAAGTGTSEEAKTEKPTTKDGAEVTTSRQASADKSDSGQASASLEPVVSASDHQPSELSRSAEPLSSSTQSLELPSSGSPDCLEGSQPSVTRESTTGESQSRTTNSADRLEGASASGGQRETARDDSAETADAAGQQIRVRLKYLNDTQRLVYADPHETVGNFRRLHFSSELEDNKMVRFIFNGQDLRNDLTTLRAYNIIDNSVVHCLITPNQQGDNRPGPANGGGQDDDVQMGALLFPVFGVILGLVWYLRFTYKQYFNAVSTVSLAGISFIYLLAFFSTVRGRRPVRHQHLE